MKPAINSLMQQCNQAALRKDIAAGIEFYRRASADTNDSNVRKFLVRHVCDLNNLLSSQRQHSHTEPYKRKMEALAKMRFPDSYCQPIARSGQNDAFVYDMTQMSEELAKSTDKWDEHLKRGILLGQYQYFHGMSKEYEAIMDGINVQIMHELLDVNLLCGRSGDFKYIEESLEQSNVDLSILHAEQAMLQQDYARASKLWKNSKSPYMISRFSVLPVINLFFGDAIQAHRFITRGFYRRGDNHKLHDLIELTKYLAAPQIPFQCNIQGMCTAGQILSYVCAGIYQTLTMNIMDIPIDLFIPDKTLRKWAAGKNIKTTEIDKNGFPEDFNQDPVDQEKQDVLLHKSLQHGLVINPKCVNVRQNSCLGMAFIQIVQLLKGTPRVTMENAVASVGHWIRIHDPLACLAARMHTPFTAYLSRNNITPKLFEPYVPRFVKSVTESLAAQDDTIIGSPDTKITDFKTPEEIYNTVKSDIYIRSKKRITYMIRLGKSLTLEYGISLPPMGHEWFRYEAKLIGLWSRLMVLYSGSRTPDNVSLFLNTAVAWLYKWMRMALYVDGSCYIGTTIFYALICSYFDCKITSVALLPPEIQLEALLARNLAEFKSNVICNLVQFELVHDDDISAYPNVLEILPTYHHRHAAMWHMNSSPDFWKYFEEAMKVADMGDVAELDSDEELEKIENMPELENDLEIESV